MNFVTYPYEELSNIHVSQTCIYGSYISCLWFALNISEVNFMSIWYQIVETFKLFVYLVLRVF